MRKYAYLALRLSEFLAQADTDLVSATQTDLLEYRALRTGTSVTWAWPGSRRTGRWTGRFAADSRTAAAKFGRPRMVYAPRAALELVRTYVLLQRRHIVAAAQPTLAKRRSDLFIVDAARTAETSCGACWTASG